MTLDITKSVDIIEIMENYISGVRPEPEIRSQLDINYEINDQSVILNEIRPVWNSTKEKMTLGYAKATYVKSKDLWKVFWKRADKKWHSYKPKPTVKELKDFLKLVDQDNYGCFKG
jgi:hypothetical protein